MYEIAPTNSTAQEMMNPERDRLLMEALKVFSSDDSDDDRISVESSDSDVDSKTDASRKVQRASTHRHSPCEEDSDDDSQLESAVESVLRGFSDGHLVDGSRRPRVHDTRPTRTNRKRSKPSRKCTYAARREEVARLRARATELETQFHTLRQSHAHSQAAHDQAQHERQLLAYSQTENARLRAMLAAGEARLRQAHAQHRRHGPYH